MKEALITAKTSVDIKDLALSMRAGQAVFIKNVEFHGSKELQDLLKVSAVTVEWVDRSRLRRNIPPMSSFPKPTAKPTANSPLASAPKAFELAEASTGKKTSDILSPYEQVQEGLKEMDAKIDRMAEVISAFPDLRQALQSILDNQTQAPSHTSAPVPQVVETAPEDPESDIPMFIPSKIMDEGMNSDLNLQETSSTTDVASAASSLRSKRKKK